MLLHVGIDNAPSSIQWIIEQSPCYQLQGNKSTIFAWVHSHVNGSKCFLSSIDMHTQFVLQNNFPHILAIVVEIAPKGKVKNEYYQITEKGKQRIASCNNEKKQSPNNFHKSCSYPRFFRSLKSQVTFTDDAFLTIEKRNLQQFPSQDLSGANEQDVSNFWVCKACNKQFMTKSILQHLRAKKCANKFTLEELAQLRQQSKTKVDEYQTNYQPKYQPKYQADYNAINREKINKRQAVYDHEEGNKVKKMKYREEQKKKTNQLQQIRRKTERNEMTSDDRILAFKKDTIDGPNFICYSCKRGLFKCNVRKLQSAEILKLLAKLDGDLINETGLGNISNFEELILCFNCHTKLNGKKFPNINVNNGLELDSVPEALSSLKDLEQQLIALSLLFMTVKQLPGTNRMKSLSHKVISVPIETTDVMKTVSKLPRHPLDSEIVAVKLKKKVEFKSAYLEEFVRPKVVIDALKELKDSGHAYYQDIEIDPEFMNNRLPVDNADEVSSNLDESEEDTDDESENPVKKYQSNQDSNTCLVPTNLDSQVVSNTTSKKIIKPAGEGRNSIEIAPGENKLPTGRLREKDGDVKAFPKHFPSGKFGINFPRKYKLSPQMYLLQRLLNQDERFSRDNIYLFMASSLVEEDQLVRQINISGIKGVSDFSNSSGEKVIKLHDPYSVFKKLKGTPKYWQTAKYELMAKVKQLGPFHLFYTFSCGEMR